jgi:flagellar biosynthesis protein
MNKHHQKNTREKKRHRANAKQATALKYDGENAPQVVAKGSGNLAEQIIEQAREHNVHIHNDPILAKVLAKLELGDEIPKQLYVAVAKIIAFAYFLQGKHPKNYQAQQSKTELSSNALSFDAKALEDHSTEIGSNNERSTETPSFEDEPPK